MSKGIGIALTLAVLGINLYFAVDYIKNLTVKHWALYTFIGVVIFLYLAFIAYLVRTHNSGPELMVETCSECLARAICKVPFMKFS